MKKLKFVSLLGFLAFLCIACSQEKKAIEITKNYLKNHPSETFNILGEALAQALSGENLKYEWKAKPTDKSGVYLVSLVSKKTGRSYFWETDVRTRKVTYLNTNTVAYHPEGPAKDSEGKSGFVEGMKSALYDFGRGVKDSTHDFWRGVKAALHDFWRGFKDGTQDAWRGFKDDLSIDIEKKEKE